MSAFAGIYTFDGAPIDPVWLASAGAALSHRGPDGGGEAIAGPVGMAYRAFHTTPESRHEHQPSTRAGVGLLTWDGRLDNRDEVRECLGGRLRAEDTDVEHVWAAYERWGSAAFGRLIGDFALALWDARVRTLWLARDAIGTRMLYYAAQANRVLWSSDIALIVSSLGDVAIDEDFVATHLLNIPELERTPYAGIRACPPGAACGIRDGVVRVNRFWKPEDVPAIGYRHDSDYEEHFRLLFRDAVRCRLRARHPVFAQLSGGLDSSSIACVARDILSRGEAGAPGLRTLSYVTAVADTVNDEPFIETVEGHLGCPSRHLRQDGDWLRLPDMTSACEFWPNSAALVAARDRRARDVLQHDNARVMMSGFGGDHLLWPHAEASPELGDLLLQWRFRSLHRTTREWAARRRTSYLRMLWMGALRPFWNGFQHVSTTPSLRRRAWLSPAIASRAADLGGMTRAGFNELPSATARFQNFRIALSSVAPTKRFCAEPVELVYPFLDRPLVAFCLGIPFTQLLRAAEGRSVQRRALVGILPDRVRKRKSKGGSGYGMGRGLAREWSGIEALLATARVFERGWIRPHAFATALTLARAGLPMQLDAVIQVLPLELWLQAFERRAAAQAAA